MAEIEVGKVSVFFAKPVVAGIALTSTIGVGDRLHVKGHTTDLELTVETIQMDNASIQAGSAGDSVGIKMPDRVRHGDTVYKIVDL